jgi:hypothetical protein
MPDEFEQLEQEQIVPELFEEPELPDEAGDAFARAEEGVESDDLVVSVEPPPAPLGRSWAFDFSAKRFVMAGHAPVETRREQTLLYWIQKCLLTPQGGSPIEPADYGFDSPTNIFGDQFDSSDIGTFEDRVREALLFHPSITGIENFRLEPDADDEEAAQVFFEAVLDDDTRLDVAAGVTP